MLRCRNEKASYATALFPSDLSFARVDSLIKDSVVQLSCNERLCATESE
jgi:hypothetical protein